MHRNVATGLLAIAVTLLSVNLVVALLQVRQPRCVHGQSAGSGSDVVVTSSNTQNEAFCFLYDRARKQLVSYRNRSTGGLELMGIRLCEFDFPDKLLEYPQSTRKTRVNNMKQLADEIAAQEEKRKAAQKKSKTRP